MQKKSIKKVTLNYYLKKLRCWVYTQQNYARHDFYLRMQKKRTDILTLVGRNLKQARILKELSLSDLGSLCNMDRGDLSKIEAGKINIGIITLFKLRAALDIPIEQFFQE